MLAGRDSGRRRSSFAYRQCTGGRQRRGHRRGGLHLRIVRRGSGHRGGIIHATRIDIGLGERGLRGSGGDGARRQHARLGSIRPGHDKPTDLRVTQGHLRKRNVPGIRHGEGVGHGITGRRIRTRAIGRERGCLGEGERGLGVEESEVLAFQCGRAFHRYRGASGTVFPRR